MSQIPIRNQMLGRWRLLISLVLLLPGFISCNPKTVDPSEISITSQLVVKGTLAGLLGGSIQLKLNSQESLTLSANGDFQFTTELNAFDAYVVAIVAQPTSPSVTCTLQNESGSIQEKSPKVLVQCPSFQSLSISAKQISIPTGAALAFQASALFPDGTTQDVTSAVTWSSLDGTVAMVTTAGVAVGVSAGTTDIKASFGSGSSTLSSTRSLTVYDANLVSLSLSPAQISFAVGESSKIKIIGVYDDGSVIDVTPLASLSSSNSTAVSAGSSGLISAAAVGSSTITATFNSVTGTMMATVISATLDHIEISPIATAAVVGQKIYFKATGVYSDNSFRDLTTTVTWSSALPAVASLSSTGLAQILSAGSTSVTASYLGKSATALLTASQKTLQSLAINVPSTTLPLGQTESLTVTGTYSDSSTADLTSTVTWSVDDDSLALISNNPDTAGDFSALSAGTVTVTASDDTTNGVISTTASMTLSAATLTNLVVTPTSTLIAKGMNLQFSAQGTYSDGSVLDVTSLVTWSSSNNALASIESGGDDAGLMTNLFSGTTWPSLTITGTLGGISKTASIIMTPTTLTGIQVNPTALSQNTGRVLQLQAYGLFSDGGSIDITDQIYWSSSQSIVGNVSNALGEHGLLTTLSEGSATITATYGSYSQTVALTVSNTDPETVTETGTGLLGSYYNGTNLNTLVGSRIDSNINFIWGQGTAPLGVADLFSVRWSGKILAKETATYTFCTHSDDGVRLSLGGTSVISNWTNHSDIENCGTYSMTAGQKYDIQLDFYENSGDSIITLSWSTPSMSKTIVPKENLFTP